MNQYFLSTNQNEEFSERKLLCFSGVIHSHEIIRTCVISLFSQFVGHIWNIDAWSVVSHRKCWIEFTKFQCYTLLIFKPQESKVPSCYPSFRIIKEVSDDCLCMICVGVTKVSRRGITALQNLYHIQVLQVVLEQYNRRTTFQQKFQVDQLLRSLNYRRKP